MPLHPAAPEDLPRLVAAFAQTVRAVLDLGRSCSDSDFRKDTACPGWTVKDQIAHVVGVEQWLAGSALPRVKVPDYDHVRSDFDRVTEADDRAAPADDRLEGRRRARGRPRHPPAPARRPRAHPRHRDQGPFGPGEAGDVLRTRILDIWTHEQDIRQAPPPGDLDSPGAAVFMDVLFASLPVVARNAGIEPGTS